MVFDVLFVITSLAVGGAERHVSAIASRLARKGHHVAIYGLHGKGPFADEAERSGVTVLGPPMAFPPRQSVIASRVRLMLSALKLYGYLLFRRPKIVHLFGPPAYVVGGVLALAAGHRRLICSRRNMNHYQAKYPLLTKLERWLHHRVCALLGNSLAVVNQLRHEEGAPEARLGLIYNGIDLAPFESSVDRVGVRAALATGPADIVMIIVANLIAYKGHADLLAALASISDQLPRSWKLWIVGRDDGAARMLWEQLRQSDLEGHVMFLEQRSDVPSLLMSADVAVSSSHEEGFSNAVLEAMAAGLPVIATDVGGNREAVVDGITGCLVPPRNPQALAQALLTVLRDRERATVMGRMGRKRVKDKFGLDACVSNYEKLYRAVIEGRAISEVSGIGVRHDQAPFREHDNGGPRL